MMLRSMALLAGIVVALAPFQAFATDDPDDDGFDFDWARGGVKEFHPVGRYVVPEGGNAEIVSVSPDGRTVAYTDAIRNKIGLVDITFPHFPRPIAEVSVDGAPTSVGFTPNGRMVVTCLQTSPLVVGQPPAVTPGQLTFISVRDGSVRGSVAIGAGPDALAVTRIAGRLVVAIAIENEPILVDPMGNYIAGDAPGLPNDTSAKGFVQIVVVDEDQPSISEVHDLRFDDEAQLTALGLTFPADPQPEFVAIHKNKVAATLQENDGVAIIDITDPSAPFIERVFSVGVVANRKADLLRDAKIDFKQSYPADVPATAPTIPYAGRRMPDAVAWNAAGTALFLADEGDVAFSGGRGWSVFTPEGTFLWDDGGSLEQTVVSYGQYPDSRSTAKGIEVEGMAVDVFGGKEFAFVGSERGGFIAIYEVTDPASPRFVQVLPTGLNPEGIDTSPGRRLVVVADEGNATPGSISLYRGSQWPFFAPAWRPTLRSSGLDNPFGALSGLAADPRMEDVIYAVPDAAFISAVFKIQLNGSTANVSWLFPVTKAGSQSKYDLEGITVDSSMKAPANRGFWLAAEGNAKFGAADYLPNLLVQVDDGGAVLQEIPLPPEIDSPVKVIAPDTTDGKITSAGFQGVAVSSDGRDLLACIRREFSKEPAVGGHLHTRIARFDLLTSTWELFLYPLEATTTKGDSVGLAEIINIGRDRYIVIERDTQAGSLARVKRLYTFTLQGVMPFVGAVSASSDLTGKEIKKSFVTDLIDEFSPFEKVEGLTLTRSKQLWGCLDNDGGSFEPRLVRINPWARWW